MKLSRSNKVPDFSLTWGSPVWRWVATSRGKSWWDAGRRCFRPVRARTRSGESRRRQSDWSPASRSMAAARLGLENHYNIYRSVWQAFFKCFGRTDYFGFLVTSSLGFKARLNCLVHIAESEAFTDRMSFLMAGFWMRKRKVNFLKHYL